MGSTPESCGLCFSMSRMASLTALPTSVDFRQREQMVEMGIRGKIEHACRMVGSGIIEARAAPGAVNGFLELGALGSEANISEAQEDETEDGLRVLLQP